MASSHGDDAPSSPSLAMPCEAYGARPAGGSSAVASAYGCNSERISGQPDRRPARCRGDPAVRKALLALPRTRVRPGRVHDRGRLPGRGGSARLRDRRWATRPRSHVRQRGPGLDWEHGPVRPCSGGRDRRSGAAGGLAGRRVPGDLLRRSGLVRPVRLGGPGRSRRGSAAEKGACARRPARPGRFRPRVRGDRGARDHRRRLHLLALALPRGLRLAERDGIGRAGGRRHVAPLLPRRGTSLFRPEGPVRVGLSTTKEARCPSTSCSRP